MLKIFDTVERRVVDFVPRIAGHVSMYVCGATPYDVPHLGHGRKEVVFDTIRRYLLWRGYQVRYVSNVTDIEDKIIERAHEAHTTEAELVRKYEAEFDRQFQRLNILPPDDSPRATEWIGEMTKLIGDLIAGGHAYVVEGQGVYFQVETLPEYGALSHRTIADLLESAGARVDVDERKRSPIDFALWKAAKPGEPSWDSPWGNGRPGWHIECSAMSLTILGDGFDIHGGGEDLVFPHHENEIAQAVAAGHEFARHWLHNGMLNVDGTKMSKSLGNFTTLDDVLDSFDPRAFRLLVTQTHYRRQMEVGEKELADAEKAVERVDTLMRRSRRAELPAVPAGDLAYFRESMDNDFDTPAALAYVFELVRDANTAFDTDDKEAAAEFVAKVREMWTALGLWWLDDDEELDGEIAALVTQRDDARARRDWAEADRVRDVLRDQGIVLEDTADGTVWRRLRPDDEV
ncbi:MAG TPA: cysteine--tRNA ligase [Acidimicrobiia bacterium]|nr:cysteine--tRNA ligase [Acidimicrobiia bacterium]